MSNFEPYMNEYWDPENAAPYRKVSASFSEGLTSLSTAKLIKRVNISLLFGVVMIIAYMFHLKSEVQDLNFEYKQLYNQLAEENRQIGLLKAELAYLNSPKRLQILAAQYLKLESVKPEQLSSPSRDKLMLSYAKFEPSKSKKGGPKWRYKNINSSIRTVSSSGNKKR